MSGKAIIGSKHTKGVSKTMEVMKEMHLVWN